MYSYKLCVHRCVIVFFRCLACGCHDKDSFPILIYEVCINKFVLIFNFFYDILQSRFLHNFNVCLHFMHYLKYRISFVLTRRNI